MMSTVPRLELGGKDHDRELTLEEFLEADYEPGYEYELIEGRLYVSPSPNLPGRFLELWLLMKLNLYVLEHSDVINFACHGVRVFVPGHDYVIAPEPDVAAYRHFPHDLPLSEIRWQDHSPLLVAEILENGDEQKDLVRNTRLYLQVPSIREYWVVDGREDPDKPTLIVHRRQGKRWVVRHYAFGNSYTTKLLPGFELLIDPRR